MSFLDQYTEKQREEIENVASHHDAHSIRGLIQALEIMSRYLGKGMDTKFFTGAEHDIIYFFGLDDKQFSFEDAKALYSLGLFVDSDTDNWAYFT